MNPRKVRESKRDWGQLAKVGTVAALTEVAPNSSGTNTSSGNAAPVHCLRHPTTMGG
jgi:hypothetical protein